MTVIVEFFGLPGVGKSTICLQSARLLRVQGFVVKERKDIEKWRMALSGKDRFIIRLLSLCRMVLHFDIFFSYLLSMKPFKLYEIARFFFLFSRPLYLSKFLSSCTSDFILLEQGCAQDIWSLSLSGLDKKYALRLFNILQKNDLYIYVNAPPDVILTRIVARKDGKSRLDGRPESEIKRIFSNKADFFDLIKDKVYSTTLSVQSIGDIHLLSRNVVKCIHVLFGSNLSRERKS